MPVSSRFHSFSVPTSLAAVSSTVSFQSPWVDSPAKALRSNVALRFSSEPPCLLDSVWLLPEGLVSVTTRSPLYACGMSIDTLPPLSVSASSKCSLDSTLELSSMAWFGVALARTVFSVSAAALAGFAAVGAKSEPSFVSESARDGPDVKAERSEARGVTAAGAERTASRASGAARGRGWATERWRLTEFIPLLSALKTYSCLHSTTFQHFCLQ